MNWKCFFNRHQWESHLCYPRSTDGFSGACSFRVCQHCGRAEELPWKWGRTWHRIPPAGSKPEDEIPAVPIPPLAIAAVVGSVFLIFVAWLAAIVFLGCL